MASAPNSTGSTAPYSDPIFNQLPNVTRSAIFNHLTRANLGQAAKVSKAWNAFAQDKCDCIWIRELPKICHWKREHFPDTPPNGILFDAISNCGEPFVEGEALFHRLVDSQEKKSDPLRPEEVTWVKQKMRFDAFARAAQEGHIRMGKRLLPYCQDNTTIIEAFIRCAENAQPDFAEWLISTNPEEHINLTPVTRIRFNCAIEPGERLCIHSRDFSTFHVSQPHVPTDIRRRRHDYYPVGSARTDQTLPLRFKQEAVGKDVTPYWTTTLIGKYMPSISPQCKPVIHAADGIRTVARGKDLTLTVGNHNIFSPDFSR